MIKRGKNQLDTEMLYVLQTNYKPFYYYNHDTIVK